MRNLNVLVLHQMGDPRYVREAIRSLEYMIPECGDHVDCVIHDAAMAFPRYLMDVDFDLIVLGPTFLCNRYSSDRMRELLCTYDFVRRSSACKVALPQDDYDCSEILDDWVVAWGVDRVYSVCAENWDLIYPRYVKTGDIRLGYTGYVSDDWIRAWKRPKAFSERSIDVSYRATRLPANFGSVGHLKSAIAERFVAAVPEGRLKLDISIDKKDLIPGHRWHDFLEDSRFCLVTPSGSSLLDPRGKLRASVTAYAERHPRADFQTVERACFPGQDRLRSFTAISPRNIEAALAETVQIATPGNYSNLMRAGEHFISLDENCSNVNEVLRSMNDAPLVDRIRRSCKEALLAEPRLRRDNMVDEILSFAWEVVERRRAAALNDADNAPVLARYRREAVAASEAFWARRRVVDGLKDICRKMDVLGMRKLLRAHPKAE